MKIGFIGCGEMGAGMVKNLVKGGYQVTTFDSDAQRQEQMRQLGVKVGQSALDTATEDVIILCLPNSDVNTAVCYGEYGLIDALSAGQTLIDCGTSRHADTLEMAAYCQARGIAFIDAPISGMPVKAESGELTIMCGGNQEDYDKVLPVLKCMGTTIVQMGSIGNGQLTKLTNQLLLNISCAAIAEVIPFAVKLGLDAEQIIQVVNTSTGRSHASEFFLPRVLKGDFDGGFSLESAYKDMQSIAALAAKEQYPLPVLAAADMTYRTALQKGYGKHSKSAMIKVYEDLTGIEVRAKPSV